MSRVSVVIPTYNRANLVSETIESVLSQTFKDMEIIVVDDGSTDNTREVLGRYGSSIKYIYQENQGLPGARNTGINASAGEYIAFTDSDDLWEPKKIESQVELFESLRRVGFVYCDYRFIDSYGNPLPKPAIYDHHPLQIGNILRSLLLFDYIPPSTVMVKRDCLRLIGNYDVNLRIASEDWDMWLRLSKRFESAYVNSPLALIRKHANNWSSDSVEKGTVEVLLKHLALDDTKEALGEEWKSVYQHSYLTIANFYYNRRKMKIARKYYLEALKASPSGRFDPDILNFIFKTMLGSRLLDTFRHVRARFSKVPAES